MRNVTVDTSAVIPFDCIWVCVMRVIIVSDVSSHLYKTVCVMRVIVLLDVTSCLIKRVPLAMCLSVGRFVQKRRFWCCLTTRMTDTKKKKPLRSYTHRVIQEGLDIYSQFNEESSLVQSFVSHSAL